MSEPRWDGSKDLSPRPCWLRSNEIFRFVSRPKTVTYQVKLTEWEGWGSIAAILFTVIGCLDRCVSETQLYKCLEPSVAEVRWSNLVFNKIGWKNSIQQELRIRTLRRKPQHGSSDKTSFVGSICFWKDLSSEMELYIMHRFATTYQEFTWMNLKGRVSV